MWLCVFLFFVLFLCLVFLGPPTNLKLDFSILGAVDDPRKIHTYDWCSYVFKRVLVG